MTGEAHQNDSGPAAEDRPLLSVVTVCFNAAGLIEKTLDSIFSQTFRDFEYVVIDGGSTDGTLEVLARYADRIQHLASEPDSGIYNAMNKAVAACRGRWINYLNAGDTFTSADVLASVAPSLGEGVDVVYGSRNYLEKGRVISQIAKPIGTIYEKMPFGHQAAFVSSVVLRESPFNETYRFAADYDLFFRLYRGGRVFRQVDVVVCDFISGGQSEIGIRPYLEAIKILLDNTSDKSVIARNHYVNRFPPHLEVWLGDVLGFKPGVAPSKPGGFLAKVHGLRYRLLSRWARWRGAAR